MLSKLYVSDSVTAPSFIGKLTGNADTATKLTSSAGSATQPVYFNDGKPVVTTYTLGKSVPADAKFTDTNTWRGVQNNLTSTSTDQSLSAAQGKVLKALIDGKAASNHTHQEPDHGFPGARDSSCQECANFDRTRCQWLERCGNRPAVCARYEFYRLLERRV